MKFGSSGRDQLRLSATPGPGAYAVDGLDGVGGRAVSSTRPRSATSRIGTSTRFEPKGAGGPGPAYNPTVEGVSGLRRVGLGAGEGLRRGGYGA